MSNALIKVKLFEELSVLSTYSTIALDKKSIIG